MNDKTKAQIDAAFDHVYTDIETFVKVCAREHTIANLGQSLEELSRRAFTSSPERLVDNCYSCLYQDCESDEMADGIQEEYLSWLKDARRDAQKVLKAGLPLTLRNARDAFELKGPFAAKAKKSRKK